jgi:hypothetical protein
MGRIFPVGRVKVAAEEENEQERRVRMVEQATQMAGQLPEGDPRKQALLDAIEGYHKAEARVFDDVGVRGLGDLEGAKKAFDAVEQQLTAITSGSSAQDPRDFGGAPGTI